MGTLHFQSESKRQNNKNIHTLTLVPSILALLMLAGLSHSLKNIQPLLGCTTMARGLFRLLSRVRLQSLFSVLSTFSVPCLKFKICLTLFLFLISITSFRLYKMVKFLPCLLFTKNIALSLIQIKSSLSKCLIYFNILSLV